jgi:hypothetical protein
MEMSQLSNELRTLSEGEYRIVYKSQKKVEVTITQTAKHSKNDFVVGLVISDQPEFRPTHIRLLIDLYIKRESNEKDFKVFFKKLEDVYTGKDPKDFVEELRALTFPMHLDEAEVNLYVAQLLMIEQDFNFGPDAPKQSKMDPPREYLMRFFRWIAAGDTQIDRIIFAAAGRRYPAPKKYGIPISYE